MAITSVEYAEELLGDPELELDDPTYVDDATEWRHAGCAELTGLKGGPPLDAPAPVATAARGALLAFAALTGATGLPNSSVLSERARDAGLTRNGPNSVGGSLRFLEATDGWVAVNLAREDDRRAVPAIVEDIATDEPWTALEKWTRDRARADVVNRCSLLGVPAAAVPDTPRADGHPFLIGRRTSREINRARPLVVDLSSLWAGPLCSRLLHGAGADVVKVESTTRPDGARSGPPAFWERLNAGKRCVTLDFEVERDRLAELIADADVVIEGSRPRALASLGIEPTDAIWVSITAYGRDDDRVGFGDDTAVAGGLVVSTGAGPTPVADAVADPLAGLHAAVAAAACLRSGRGALVEVALRDVAAYVASGGA